ncbi:unnamed protein product [Caenorhabditis sp. 36 PRJEB53466]|nr:unnamed protein product [Caenorhabditis sp. 36 PRJEB53466]
MSGSQKARKSQKRSEEAKNFMNAVRTAHEGFCEWDPDSKVQWTVDPKTGEAIELKNADRADKSPLKDVEWKYVMKYDESEDSSDREDVSHAKGLAMAAREMKEIMKLLGKNGMTPRSSSKAVRFLAV